MGLRQRQDDDGPGIDPAELDAELGMIITHLAAIDTSTSGVGAALEAIVDMGDDTLAYTDEQDGLTGATVDGADLLAEMDTIDTAVRRARRIIELRRIALEQGA